jgi:DNA-binding LacI/PurR family transcriptional regulator
MNYYTCIDIHEFDVPSAGENLYNRFVRKGSVSSADAGKRTRYHAIREQIRRDIETKRYSPGERLPSDSELAARFSVSRLTVIRSLRELEAESLVKRRAGSGTYVQGGADPATVLSGVASRVFGLLMPDLGDGEVFEPVARAIAHSGEKLHHRLLWGEHPAPGQDKEQQAEDLCRYLILRRVAGVFFAPVEHTPHQDEVNQRIAAALDEAGIPVVLIDRHICRYPERGRYDLVGIDNRRAGYRMTKHLVDRGCRRIVFASRPGAAPTVAARQSGYREALWDAGLECAESLPVELDRDRSAILRKFLKSTRPDAVVCANDLTAATLMHDLLKLGVRIPEEIRMVGINDVKYASFLPVPLTTLHQPCHQLGAEAMVLMLDRLQRPDAPARDVLLDCDLVIRLSCGSGD